MSTHVIDLYRLLQGRLVCSTAAPPEKSREKEDLLIGNFSLYKKQHENLNFEILKNTWFAAAPLTFFPHQPPLTTPRNIFEEKNDNLLFHRRHQNNNLNVHVIRFIFLF